MFNDDNTTSNARKDMPNKELSKKYISPIGLLASVIYIDLFNVTQETAIKKLLNGVDCGDNPRKKPTYPGLKSKEDFPGNES